MSNVSIKRWWMNKKTKIAIDRILTFINRNWESFVDINIKSFWLVLAQGLLIGAFLQAIISINFNDPFLSFRLFFLIFISTISLFFIWGVYAVMVSKLYLKRLSRGGIFEVLKYDAYSYIPLSLSMLVWIIATSLNFSINIFPWLIVTGLLPIVVLKILLLVVFKKPNKDVLIREKGQGIKERHVDNVNNLDADLAFTLMFDKNDRKNLRKHIVNCEIRNSTNLTSLKKNSIIIKNKLAFDLLNYSIGWPNKEKFGKGNLKLYLDDGKTEKLIFNKNAENILSGWNEFQVPLPSEQNEITLKWKSTIKEAVYLSVSKLSSTKEKPKQKKQNIIVIIFDGVRPETIGLYQGKPEADHISRFFSSNSSVMFSDAYVQGEWTMPNFACIASSLYQSHHTIYDPDYYSSKLPANKKTLAEILQENGFNTLGYVGHNRVSPGYGHARGYDKFFYRLTRRQPGFDHKDILFQTLRFLKENKNSNNFVFLHVFDTHHPHFQTTSNISSLDDALFNNNVDAISQKTQLEKEGFSFMQEIYHQKYREVDSDFSLLFDYITKYENDCTSVIFSADHGVIYFDRDMKNIISGGRKGGRKKYLVESMLKAPLFVRLPPTNKNQKFQIKDDIIESNLTIMPTALEIAGIQPPDYIDGVSIFKNNDVKKSGKNYAISESLYKDRYELFLKTNEFKYYLKINRDRATGEILSTIYDETIFDPGNSIITNTKTIKEVKNKVKKLAKDNRLPDAVKDKL